MEPLLARRTRCRPLTREGEEACGLALGEEGPCVDGEGVPEDFGVRVVVVAVDAEGDGGGFWGGGGGVVVMPGVGGVVQDEEGVPRSGLDEAPRAVGEGARAGGAGEDGGEELG